MNARFVNHDRDRVVPENNQTLLTMKIRVYLGDLYYNYLGSVANPVGRRGWPLAPDATGRDVAERGGGR